LIILCQRSDNTIKVSLGPTFTTERSQGFTHALIVDLKDKAALSSYSVDPFHVSVIQKDILPICEAGGVLAMDIEE
jgi:hypothetical protein